MAGAGRGEGAVPGRFAYVDGQIDDKLMTLVRRRYASWASRWGFAVNRGSHHDFEEGFLPTGVMGGSPEDALDCAFGCIWAILRRGSPSDRGLRR